jgi:heme-degrading monooxygenase HmoA
MLEGRVVRVWKGEGTRDGVARYCAEHFPHHVLPQLRGVDGFLEARVLVHTTDTGSELVVMTTWASLEAVKAFAGEDFGRAVVEPAVAELLEHVDEDVTHYAIAHDVV